MNLITTDVSKIFKISLENKFSFLVCSFFSLFTILFKQLKPGNNTCILYNSGTVINENLGPIWDFLILDE